MPPRRSESAESSGRSLHASIPSVDRILNLPSVAALVAEYGRGAVVSAVRDEVGRLRASLGAPCQVAESAPDRIATRVAARLDAAGRPSLRRVFNLTGTILHTNLGRAVLPQEVADAIASTAVATVNLEFDLDAGKRDDRDRHVEAALLRMTGAERATVVNNNAAAVLLALNTLAARREVIVSRGELIEIGGEFRLPEIMKRAGCALVEVGTTNRTHLRDYAEAIGPRTALLMKVHPSNYHIVGFTKSVGEVELSGLARERGVPLLCDLGAGALLDLRRWGLPYENTAAAMIEAGVDLVSFSGDKLLGGPQAGILAGRRALVERINRNALKRALRVDKLRIAGLEALLRLYSDPDRLAARLPVLRHMSRPASDIEAQAARVLAALSQALAGCATAAIEPCESQVGSGSLPADRLPSFSVSIRPNAGGRARRAPGGRRGESGRLEALALGFRSLPIPVIGRIHEGALKFDLRCLEDETAFLAQMAHVRAVLDRPRSENDTQ